MCKYVYDRARCNARVEARARIHRQTNTHIAYLHVEQDLEAAALKGCTLGSLQVSCPLVEVVLHCQLNVLVLQRAPGRSQTIYSVQVSPQRPTSHIE